MGKWVGSNTSAAGPPPYAANASWSWTVEPTASLPTPGTAGAAQFWEHLFSSMAADGLGTYKLDHSQQQQPQMALLLQTVGATEQWLREMAAAAARHGISKQCL